MEFVQPKVRINYQIKTIQVRLVSDDGSSQVIQTTDALKMAKDQNVDLIEINAKTTPPIAVLMSFGKFKYEEKKKFVESKKKQKIQELKELNFHYNTDENDLIHKINQAKEFLADGNKVKFGIKFRGREITFSNIGREKLNWISDQLKDYIAPNSVILTEGKLMHLTVNPKK